VARYTNPAVRPGTAGSQQPEFTPDLNGFVARFDPSLRGLKLATYLQSNNLLLYAMAIHPSTSEILLAGESFGHGAIGRIDPSLTSPPQWNNFDGWGPGEVFGIAVDRGSGDIFASGWTQGIAGAEGGAQAQPGGSGGDTDGFAARFDSTLTTLKQATYIGGADNHYAYGIAVHPSSGAVYVTGETLSTDRGSTFGAAQSKSNGGFDGFVARLNPTLTRFVQTTYLGGTGDDTPHAIAIHPVSGEILVAGETTSADLPDASCSARSSYAGGSEFLGGDGFVSLLSADLRAKSAQAPEDSFGH